MVLTPEGAAELAGITVAATINGTGTLDANLTGTASTFRSQGYYRFVYDAGSAQAVDEYDIWDETITTPS